MSARVLIVDDLFPNVKLLETKLGLEYFDTVAAMNGPDAIAICEKGLCDLVLLDVMMPGMDGFEVCRILKNNPLTAHIPVVMVTALDQPSDRLSGLDAGADDFLTKPIDDTALFSRVRSLVRLKAVTDEAAQSRARLARSSASAIRWRSATAETGLDANILLVEDRPGAAERMAGSARPISCGHGRTRPAGGDPRGGRGRTSTSSWSASTSKVSTGCACAANCGSLERTRQVPLIMLAEEHDRARVVRGLDFGVHDLPAPSGRPKRAGRARTHPDPAQALCRGAARRRAGLDGDGRSPTGSPGFTTGAISITISPAVRRDPRLRERPVAALILDIDHFKGSTTPTATRPATRCCAPSPSASACTPDRSTSSRATAARKWW